MPPKSQSFFHQKKGSVLLTRENVDGVLWGNIIFIKCMVTVAGHGKININKMASEPEFCKSRRLSYAMHSGGEAIRAGGGCRTLDNASDESFRLARRVGS